MFSETTESPLSSTSVNNLGGAEAAEIMIYPSARQRLARHLRLAKKKPPNLAGAHGVTIWMPLRAHARVSYHDDRKCHFGKPQIFECPARSYLCANARAGQLSATLLRSRRLSSTRRLSVACLKVAHRDICRGCTRAVGIGGKRTSPTVYEYTAY